MTSAQIIVLAIPLFLLLMLGELVLARRRGMQVYRFSDALNSLSLGALSQLSGLFTKLLAVGIYTAVYQKVALFPDVDSSFAPFFWPTGSRGSLGISFGCRPMARKRFSPVCLMKEKAMLPVN